MRKLIRKLLIDIGEDPKRERLAKTPGRVERPTIFYERVCRRSRKVLNNALFVENYDEMVIVKDIDLFSMCEHHLLPFFGAVTLPIFPIRKSSA